MAGWTARLRAYGPYVLLAAALAFLCWCTLTTISRPGLHYDEALFVNAALGGHYANGAFVADRFHGLVTMVMPYVGALKSWLWAPVFAVFGVDVESIRVPAVVVVVATVGLAFRMARRQFGPWPAALLAVLMATDPAYMTMAKTDFGPVALSGFLRVGALAAYFAWARTESVRYLWLLAAAIALGLFNKVDFLAFAGAFAVTAVVVDHRGIVRQIRRRPLPSLLPAAALLPVLLLEYVQIVVPARRLTPASPDIGIFDRISQAWGLYRGTFDGTSFYLFMTTEPLHLRTAVVAATIAAVVLATALVAWWLLGRLRGAADAQLAASAHTTAFLLVLLLTMAAVLTATPQAMGPHHAILLWPLPALLAVSLVAAAARLRPHAAQVAVTAALVLGVVGLTVTQVRVADAYRARLAHDGGTWTSVWTTEVYPMTAAVRRVAPSVDTVLTTDWGTGNELLALGGDAVRTRLAEGWATFAVGDRPTIDQIAATVLHGHRVVVVFHRQAAEVMPKTYARTMAMLTALGPAHGVQPLYRGRALLAYLVDDRPRGA